MLSESHINLIREQIRILLKKFARGLIEYDEMMNAFRKLIYN